MNVVSPQVIQGQSGGKGAGGVLGGLGKVVGLFNPVAGGIMSAAGGLMSGNPNTAADAVVGAVSGNKTTQPETEQPEQEEPTWDNLMKNVQKMSSKPVEQEAQPVIQEPDTSAQVAEALNKIMDAAKFNVASDIMQRADTEYNQVFDNSVAGYFSQFGGMV